MFATDDTIVAISTPLGRGGLGVVRVSGADAPAIVQRLLGRRERLRPRHATFATLRLPARESHAGPSPEAEGVGALADQVVVTYFPAPHSATGDEIVEISAHGSPLILSAIVKAAMQSGARLAEPGEFTLRAFLNGKIDLVQAEAVSDLIEAVTPLQARAAFDQLEGTLTTRIQAIESALFDLMARLEASLDFSEEGYHFVEQGTAAGEIGAIRARISELLAHAGRGRLIRDGAQIAIVGAPNVGKSSLFNALVNANRAIVTSIPGTTRDLLTERADIRGIAVSLIDTAGIRESADVVEIEGIARARQAAAVADLVIVVLDHARPLGREDRALLDAPSPGARLVAVNKTDLTPAWSLADEAVEGVEVSATTGQGLDTLVDRMATALGGGLERRDQPLVSNMRHIDLLGRANAALGRAHDALQVSNGTVSEEFVLADLQDASAALQEISGVRSTDDLLAHIFSRFCIGK